MILVERALKPIRLDLMHASLHVFDTPEQQGEDIHDLFQRARGRRVAWVTGTEAGRSKKGRDQRAHLHTASEQYDYRLALGPSDAWIAVNRDLITGGWQTDYDHVLDTRNGKRGVQVASFLSTPEIGDVSVLACHYPTQRNSRHADIQRLAKAIGRRARVHGKGNKSLVFYGGDQNIVDRHRDTFLGEPLTSTWDELKKWEGTGHGNIDVIASYDNDKRVSAAYCRALGDKQFPQYSDHFVVESGFDILPLSVVPDTHPCPSCGNVHRIQTEGTR